MCLSSLPRAWDCQMEGQHALRCWAVRRWKALLSPCPQMFWHPTELMWYQRSLQPRSPCWAQASWLLFQKPEKCRKVQMRDTQRAIASVKHQEAGTLPNKCGCHGVVPTVDQGSSDSCDSVVTQLSCLQDLHFLAALSHPQLPGDVVSRCLAEHGRIILQMQLQGTPPDFNSYRATRSLSISSIYHSREVPQTKYLVSRVLQRHRTSFRRHLVHYYSMFQAVSPTEFPANI